MRKLRYFTGVLLLLFILLNILVATHSYGITHFKENAPPLPVESLDIPFFQKIKIALFGIDIPKPKASVFPKQYEDVTIPLDDDDYLSAWHIKTDSVRQGVVILFHGFMEEKSAMLPKAEEILKMGYDVYLVDFMGAGESCGTQSTIGYLEAKNVHQAYNFVSERVEEGEKLFLLGFSMGAVAVIRAQGEKPMNVDGLILEAPYSTLRNTVGSRADLLGVPREPAASIFTFWIGVTNGFNGFNANPIEFAEEIETPVLHMCGAKDQYISVAESEDIQQAIASENKTLHLFEDSTHESYLLKHKKEWIALVSEFLLIKN